ncbi:PilT/PilU family type 4a pilus ATPase [Ostreibacterium oceani]|uniref:PilT/PilU family type 4a pilus ATPase n=1 Tax=Ostreibacterium oceani TaxID=2654998 RepID=A0A6N7EVE9_9GAMM|nr:PilT/PilU family type 4a pilus ATPase [Ostreibacterium oceani]MPV86744.1 PilT/PilU family type 4a pilus ATPase [Ostreibacterium oceani]
MTPQEASQLITKLTKLLHKQKGSDIIINANAHPALKIDGAVRYIKEITLKSNDTETIAKSLMTARQFEQFMKHSELNFLLEYPGLAHLRTNVFKQRGEIGLVMRLISIKIPSIEDLKIPLLLKEYALLNRGLVLFTGATGVGKSTSLAAMIDYRNETRADHIITVEDPIEFVYQNKKSIITQREVGVDTESYAEAMKSALRQAPDAVLVGEIRDRDVMEQALAFAETGHMVFATVHATSAKITLERIVNQFPSERRDQVLLDLSENLKVIVTQRLLNKAHEKGRIPALEIMSITPHIKFLIREGRFNEIDESMARATLREGVIAFDSYLLDLYEQDVITYQEALRYAESPHNFRMRLRTESNRELPPEFQTEAHDDWDVEESVKENSHKQTWGSFNKSST